MKEVFIAMKEVFIAMEEVFFALATFGSMVAVSVVFFSVISYLDDKREIEELEEICPNYELYLSNVVKNNEVLNQCISSAKGVVKSTMEDDADDIIEQCRYHANSMYPTLEVVRFHTTTRAIHRTCRSK